MVKTQVQIPDELFAKAKKVAAAKGCSFAEIVRNGLEYMIRVNPPQQRSRRKWRLPKAVDLGSVLAGE